MNDLDKPPEPTLPQSPEDVGRVLNPRAQFQAGQPVPNREMWVLERELGIGGFGAVWLAKHEWKAERVAVKFCTHPAARHQLLTHEKKVVARVMRHGGDHPNVVALLDCNLSGETPWLIYEYVPGGTLAEAVVGWREVPLARRLARTVRVMHALAGALSTFHRLDPPIVHRDMKPHNVLMADGKVPKITDFGLGGAVFQGTVDGSDASGHSVMLPEMLRAMGTVRYAPPEQMLGSPPSPRDDVYALGVIAFQLATTDLKAVPGTDAQDELRKLRAPADLIALVVKSVAMDPARRPKDATEWERKLARLLPKPGDPLGVPLPPTAKPVPLDLGGGVAPVAPPAAPPDAPTPSASRAPTEAELRVLAETDFQTAENFYHGRGTPQDYARAMEWYEKAAAQNHPGAFYALGVMHFHGYGVPADHARGREWYEKAAALGHAVAQYNLGVISELGRGGAQDFGQAREWYEKAAAQGHPAAQNNLGVAHETGRGVPRDLAKAREWYQRAAAQGYAPACYNLAALFDTGRGGIQDFGKAREWYEKAAAQGHPKAQHNLGVMYELGRGVRQNDAEARRWYEQAAAQGHADAEASLGVLYELGRSVQRDYEEARQWYEKAAAKGHAKARAYLAELYERGLGGPRKMKSALELYAQAAAQGVEAARLALLRLKGKS
jgi:TPR repeat protein